MVTAEARLVAADGRMAAAGARAAEAEHRMAEADARMSSAQAVFTEGTEAIAAAEASGAAVEARSGAVEERSAEVDRRFAELRVEGIAAAAQAQQTMNTAEEWAAQHRASAEDEVVSLVDRAWRSAAALQDELTEEADAEALAITWQATLDAVRIREEAEVDAKALRALARSQVDEREIDVAPEAPRSVPSVTTPTVARGGSPVEVDVAAEPGELDPAPVAGRARRRLYVAACVSAVVLGAILIRSQVGAPYTIESESMDPALIDGERVVVNKFLYDVRAPGRRDVVVIDPAVDRPDDALVKRVVGLPGETIEGRDGTVLVNGRALSEPYLESDVVTADFAPVELRADELFVLGDNREASSDSRAFGPVTTDEVVGRAEAVVWPPSDLRRL